MHEPAVPRQLSKRRWQLAALATVATLLTAEIGAAALEPRLPEPMVWPSTQVAAKVAQMDELAKNGSKVNVVFLGSSVVEQGINPLSFNSAGDLLAYNAALNGASPQSLELWAKEVVFPRLDPQVVVIGLTSRDLNDGGLSQQQFFTHLQTSDGFRRLSRPQGFARWLEAAAETSAFWRIRSLLRQPGSTLIDLLGRGKSNRPGPGPFGAESPTTGATTYNASTNWRRFWTNRHFNDFSLGGQELEALKRLVQDSLDQGREVVVVEMPIHDDYLDVQPNGEAAVNQFQALVEKTLSGSSAELINLTHGFGATDFRDPAHLTPDAAGRLGVSLAARVAGISAPSVRN